MLATNASEPPRPTFRHWCEYLLVRIFICVVQSLRIETCATLSRFLAFVANDVIRLRRGVIEDNLRHAMPDAGEEERRMLRREMWRHLFLMICEIAHVPRKVQRTNWRQFVTIENEPGYVRSLLDPRPLLIVSGHFGNFEAAGYICGLFGFPTYTIARTLDNPLLDTFVKRFREAKGQYILPKVGSAEAVQEVLQRGEPLTLLGDQAAGPKGQWVYFMNRPASCHKALALFSLVNRAPMLVSLVRRSGKPMKFVIGYGGFYDPDESTDDHDLYSLTAWYSDRLEEAVRLCPEQFWWLHRRWKCEPPPRQLRQLEKRRAEAQEAEQRDEETRQPKQQLKEERTQLEEERTVGESVAVGQRKVG